MWNDVEKVDNKPTEKQIKYAEVLMEACYGDIIKPIKKMTKQQLSILIDEMITKANEEGIDYHKFFPQPKDAKSDKPIFKSTPQSATALIALREAARHVPFYGVGEIEAIREMLGRLTSVNN